MWTLFLHTNMFCLQNVWGPPMFTMALRMTSLRCSTNHKSALQCTTHLCKYPHSVPILFIIVVWDRFVFFVVYDGVVLCHRRLMSAGSLQSGQGALCLMVHDKYFCHIFVSPPASPGGKKFLQYNNELDPGFTTYKSKVYKNYKFKFRDKSLD